MYRGVATGGNRFVHVWDINICFETAITSENVYPPPQIKFLATPLILYSELGGGLGGLRPRPVHSSPSTARVNQLNSYGNSAVSLRPPTPVNQSVPVSTLDTYIMNLTSVTRRLRLYTSDTKTTLSQR